MGQYAKAETLALRALAIREKVAGPASPDAASAAASVARARVRLGHLDEAETILKRALAAEQKAVEPKDPSFSDVLMALGELRQAQRRPAEAVAPLEQALGIADAYAKPEILLTLADALFAIGKQRERARSLAAEARAAYERLGHSSGLARATRFLADHPP